MRSPTRRMVRDLVAFELSIGKRDRDFIELLVTCPVVQIRLQEHRPADAMGVKYPTDRHQSCFRA